MSIHVKSKNVVSNEIQVKHDHLNISKLPIFYIDELSINDFENVNSFNSFKVKATNQDIKDFEYTIDWFNRLNKDSGIQETIYHGIEIYLNYIECTNYINKK